MQQPGGPLRRGLLAHPLRMRQSLQRRRRAVTSALTGIWDLRRSEAAPDRTSQRRRRRRRMKGRRRAMIIQRPSRRPALKTLTGGMAPVPLAGHAQQRKKGRVREAHRCRPV